MQLLAFSTSPLNKPKLAAYLLAMAAIAGFSWAPLGPRAGAPVALPQDGGGPPRAVFALLRFGKPADEVLEHLPAIGIPWFLRRAGVTGTVSASGPGQIDIALSWNGSAVGRYTERVQPIDADRARVYFAFEPGDMALVQRLAAPIDSSLDPLSLLRMTLAEHVRSSLDGDGFRINVLKPDSPRHKLDALFGGIRAEPRRDSDDFQLDDADLEEASIRKAYRDEAERAGSSAPDL